MLNDPLYVLGIVTVILVCLTTTAELMFGSLGIKNGIIKHYLRKESTRIKKLYIDNTLHTGKWRVNYKRSLKLNHYLEMLDNLNSLHSTRGTVTEKDLIVAYYYKTKALLNHNNKPGTEKYSAETLKVIYKAASKNNIMFIYRLNCVMSRKGLPRFKYF